MPRKPGQDLWGAAFTERAVLADDLRRISRDDWARPSLCDGWTIQDVVAHMTASASIGPVRWLASVLGARFDFDLHNERRLAEYRGAEPAETLALFQGIATSTTSAPGPSAAWLGEVAVHSEDIRHPLGIRRAVPIEFSTAVADFYARRNLAVPTHTRIAGLRLEATDGPFTYGDGPLVTGTTSALIMAMAGRAVFCDELTGDGVTTLRARLT